MLNKKTIEKHLQDLKLNIPVVFFDVTDSTNTRAKEFAKSRGNERTPVLFVANAQTAGRGRMGRSFVSNENAGIYMSLLIYPDERGFDATRATAMAAVAISRAVDITSNTHAEIKWVNDVYLEGKKLAGILCEGEVLQNGEIGYMIVGMGINVYKNAISEEISAIATSIESEAGDAPDRSLLCALAVREMLDFKGNLYEEYKSRSFIINKTVRVIRVTEEYEAKVLDINDDFSLTIERDGKTEQLFTGEISIKI